MTRRAGASPPIGVRRFGRTFALALVTSSLVVLSSMIVVPAGPTARAAEPGSGSGTALASCSLPAESGTCGPRAAATPAEGGNWTVGQILDWAPSAAPAAPAGSGAGLAADGPTGEAVLFGGNVGGNLSATTQLYDVASGHWTEPTLSPSPSARSDFAFAADPADAEAVLFGGVVNAQTMRVDRATWLFSFSTDSWTNISSPSAPPAREDAAFAVDPGTGLAYLFGGENLDFSTTSSVTYDDLWSFNFTSHAWTQVNASGTTVPPPLSGASLVWNSDPAGFLLYGGCYPCTSDVWSLSPGTDAWSLVTPLPGAAPAPREEAAFAADPSLGWDLLYGGTDGAVTWNDSWAFRPATDAWLELTPDASPGARADAAYAWMAETGNASLLFSGGNLAAPAVPDLWQLAATSNLTIQVDTAANGTGIGGAIVTVDNRTLDADASGAATVEQVDPAATNVTVVALGFAGANLSFWLAPGASVTRTISLGAVADARLSVLVIGPNGSAVAGADVVAKTLGTVVAASPPSSADSGWANFTDVPTALPVPPTNLTVTAADAYADWTTIHIVPGATEVVQVSLISYPELEIHVVGELANLSIVNVRNASVFEMDSDLGLTSPSGWLNTTSTAAGTVPLYVVADGFGPLAARVSLPRTGPAPVLLVMTGDAFGTIHVVVRDAVTGLPVAAEVRATASVATSSVAATGASLTNDTGVAVLALPQAFYWVNVSAASYVSQSSGPSVRVLSGLTVNLTFALVPRPGATVDVLVRDGTTGASIPDAVVAIPFQLDHPTSAGGWANFTNVHFGLLPVVVSHPGYVTNTTNVTFTIGEVLDPLLVNLTPLPPSAITTPTPWGGLSAGLSAAWPFLFLLIVVGGGVALYLFSLRIPRRETPSGSR
ncbi:MAG TPA: kelch repeat-containing protein [Thermoplasmata archaeon]|nr:kelch repeat-containing protein [Thermoplasmata archaeon]